MMPSSDAPGAYAISGNSYPSAWAVEQAFGLIVSHETLRLGIPLKPAADFTADIDQVADGGGGDAGK